MAKPPQLPHDRAVLAFSLLAGLPALVLALYFTWHDHHDLALQLLVTVVVALSWAALAVVARQRVVRPLQTMSNLLLALREGDYSFRARSADYGDPLGDVLMEINSLGTVLQTQRRGTMEMTALLRTVMERIDVAIFAFDQDNVLRLANRAGERLLAEPEERLLGRPAAAIGLGDCLEGEPQRLLAARAFPGAQGRWGLRRSTFREDGRPHQLLVIANLTQPLREEELKAWQGLVRVLGHELNNSLAPIKSIAGSLGSALRRDPRPPDWEEDLRSGLDVIAARAESLGRFLQAYSRLARLPPPTLAPCDLRDLAQRVAALESRQVPIQIIGGAPIVLPCDAVQVEQLLINLVKNAADAALESRNAGRSRAGVRISGKRRGTYAEIRVEDDGPGLAQTANLFVPFFTTKPEGSGIGLVLCRQIAENHGGSLELANRPDQPGCVATLRLPLN